MLKPHASYKETEQFVKISQTQFAKHLLLNSPKIAKYHPK